MLNSNDQGETANIKEKNIKHQGTKHQGGKYQISNSNDQRETSNIKALNIKGAEQFFHLTITLTQLYRQVSQ